MNTQNDAIGKCMFISNVAMAIFSGYFWGSIVKFPGGIDHPIFPKKTCTVFKKDAFISYILQGLAKMVKHPKVWTKLPPIHPPDITMFLLVGILESLFWGKCWHGKRQVPSPAMLEQHIVKDLLSVLVKWQARCEASGFPGSKLLLGVKVNSQQTNKKCWNIWKKNGHHEACTISIHFLAAETLQYDATGFLPPLL